jgi:hypothetical protein
MGLILKDEKYVIEPGYEITFSTLPDPNFEKLPEEAKERISRTLRLSRSEPENTIPDLLELKKEFPDVPLIYNYLYNAYLITKKMKDAEAVAAENYNKNPDYLFARINYAFTKFKKKEYDKIPAIFNNKFDLKEIYPKRKIFHISEYTGLADFLTMYFLEVKKVKEAEEIMNNLIKIVPSLAITLEIKKRVRKVLYKTGKAK